MTVTKSPTDVYWPVANQTEGVKCGVCHSAADPFGDHQVGCGGNGDRILRHNSVCDSIFHAARSAALAPQKEVPSLIPGSHCRPADILLPNWERGQPAAMDVTVISSLQPLTLQGAASSAGHALAVAGCQLMPPLAVLLGSLSSPLLLKSWAAWVKPQPPRCPELV